MKICFISTFPPKPCGIGSYTSYLVKALLKEQKEVEILIVAEKGAKRFKSKRLEICPCFERKEKDYASKIFKKIKTYSPSSVHIEHEFAIFYPNDQFLNLLKKLQKITRIVLTLHTTHDNKTSDWQWAMNMKMNEYNRQMAKSVDQIIVHQESMKNFLVRQGIDKDKISVIFLGTEILKNISKVKARKILNLPQREKIILSFGFFGRRHAKENIIDALPHLLKKGVNAYLFFSGYPRSWVPEDLKIRESYFQRAKKLNVSGHVIFSKKYIPDEKIYLVFSACDAAVFPYTQKYPSASAGVHLAMGSGLPVVVTKIPKFEDIWQNVSGDISFRPGNTWQLTKMLSRLFTKKKFRKSIIQKEKAYAKMTSWPQTAKKHFKIYRSLQEKSINCLKGKIKKIISKSPVPEDFGHSKSICQWVGKLYPKADVGLQIAALGHDIDRAMPKEKILRKNYKKYNEFKKAHAANCAKILEEIMRKCKIEGKLIKKTAFLVRKHEFGGNEESNILKYADSLSFFQVNLPYYFSREGISEAKRRFLWGYKRLPLGLQKLVNNFKYKNKKLNYLVKEWLKETKSKA